MTYYGSTYGWREKSTYAHAGHLIHESTDIFTNHIVFTVFLKRWLLTASVWIGCTANNMADTKLEISGRNMEHILKQTIYLLTFGKLILLENIMFCLLSTQTKHTQKLLWYVRTLFTVVACPVCFCFHADGKISLTRCYTGQVKQTRKCRPP